MKMEDVVRVLSAKPAWNVTCRDWKRQEVGSCHASDLISDLLTFGGYKPLLLTGLTNTQVVRTAELLDFVAICFVRNKMPQPETVSLAEEKNIPLFVTPLLMYESCGLLYAEGLPPGIGKKEMVECRMTK